MVIESSHTVVAFVTVGCSLRAEDAARLAPFEFVELVLVEVHEVHSLVFGVDIQVLFVDNCFAIEFLIEIEINLLCLG